VKDRGHGNGRSGGHANGGHINERRDQERDDGRSKKQTGSTKSSRQKKMDGKGDRPIYPEIALMTADDVLYFGLVHAGFGDKRQKVRHGLLMDRFMCFYGPEPRTVRDMMFDLHSDFPDISFKDLMMTMNWAKRYDPEHVLAGRWGYGEDHIRDVVKDVGRKIQSFKERLIIFDPNLFDDDEINWITVDCVNFTTHEFRQNPSTGWYDHKSNSSGLKYEFALPIRHPHCIWIRGPFEPGKNHDKTVFCGGKEAVPLEKRDRDALYFRLPDGKRGFGDSAYEGIDKITIKRDGQTKEVRRFIDRALNRQETYHWRLEGYDILKQRFRHGKSTANRMELHKMAVEMVAVIVHYDLKYRPLCEV